MTTLSAYVLRELLKAFVLTVIALAALFTMAGGLVSVIRFKGVTFENLVYIIPMLLPIIVTLTMPVAALFAATIVYGRLAADNELVACRAAGINVHRLFLVAMLLSVFVTAFALLSANYTIPGSIKRIEHYVRTNLRDFAFHQLRTQGRVHFGEQYFLSADGVRNVSRSALKARNFETGRGISYMWVTSPTFLQLDAQGEVVRFTAAKGGLCQFDTREDDLRVNLYVSEARGIDENGMVVRLDGQRFFVEFPRTTPRKPSMVNLNTLLEWRERPWEADRLVNRIRGFREKMLAHLFFEQCAARLNAGQDLELLDNSARRTVIRAAQADYADRQLRLVEPRVAVHDERFDRAALYQAPRGSITVQRDGGAVLVHLGVEEGRPVLVQLPRSSDYAHPREYASQTLDALEIPASIREQWQAYSPRVLADPARDIPLSDELAEQRSLLADKVAQMRRSIAAVIHFRFGYSASALVTILMGAALGVVFRGSQPLAAFGLACIPFAIVTILVMMGRSLAEKPGVQLVGISIIWGGLIALALADLILLRVGVRR